MLDWIDDKLEARGLVRADLIIWPLGMAMAMLWALPFVWMVSTSLKFPGDVMTKDIELLPHRITFENYVKVFEYPIVRWGLNSLIQATVNRVMWRFAVFSLASLVLIALGIHAFIGFVVH